MINFRVFFQHKFLALLIVVFFLSPAFLLIPNFFQPGNENWNFIFKYFLKQEIITSLLLLLSVCSICFVFTFFLAFLICFYEFPGRKVFQYLLIFPFTIPAYIGAYAYHKFFDFASPFNSFIRENFNINHFFNFDLFSFWGCVFIFSLFFYPYLYISLYVFFNKNIGELLDVARTLKANYFSIFYKILIPLAKPVIISGISLIAMEVIRDFGVTSYLGIQTFPLAIFKIWFGMDDLKSALKLSSYLIPIIFLILFLFYRFSGKRISNHTSNREIKRRKLGNFSSFCAFFFCISPIILGYFLPILIMLRYSIIVLQKQNSLLFSVFEVIKGTFLMSLIPMILISSISMYIAYTARKGSSLYSAIFSFQYALPGLIVAILLIFVIDKFEKLKFLPIGSLVYLRNSFILLFFAYTKRFLLLGYNTISNTFRSIGFTYIEVAKTLGSSELKTFWKIEFSLLLPSLFFSAMLIIIDIMKELPMTLFLRPFNFDTLSTRTYDLVNDEMFAEGCPSALALTFFAGICIILALKCGKNLIHL